MDYEALAKKYGGTPVTPKAPSDKQQRTPELYDIDYSALAKKYGGTPVATSEDIPEAPMLLPPILVEPNSATAPVADKSRVSAAFSYKSKLAEQFAPRAAVMQEKSAQAKLAEESKIPVAELSSNPENYKTILDFSKARYNRVPARGETKEEFTAKFLTDMRNDDFNTLDLISSLNYMRNAKPEDAAKTAMAKALYEKTRSPFQKGGQEGISPYTDVLKALATDPVNYFGGIAGFFTKQGLKNVARYEARVLAGEQAAKTATAQAFSLTPGKALVTAAVGEGAIGAGQSVLGQRLDQEEKKALNAKLAVLEKKADTGSAVDQEKLNKFKEQTAALGVTAGKDIEALSYSQMAVAAIFTSAFGYAGAKGAMTTFGMSGADELNDLMKKAKTEAAVTNPNAPVTPVEKGLADPVAAQMNLEAAEFMKREGAKILEEVSPLTPLLDAKIANDMSARAVRVARHIIDNDPSFRLGPNEQIGTAIANVFSKLDSGEIDDAVLEQAISLAGLTPRQFAQANKLTLSEAAAIMQQYSVASRALNKAKELDPELKKIADELFGKPNDQTSAFGSILNGINRLENESKAWVVSGIGTTVRNVLGTIPVLTYTSAASVIEGTLYTAGKVVSAGASGQRMDTLYKGMADTMKDAFAVYGYLAKTDLSDEVTYSLLEHNPSIRNNILSATQVGGEKNISQVAQLFNSLNAAQDAWFRKAIFNAAVEKNARRAGLDPFLIMAENKAVPASILQKSADDALKATFSYQPKIQPNALQTGEAAAETAANYFIKIIDKIPFGSVIATFPRFMSNAIAFQYRYSVLGATSGAADILRGGTMEAAGDAAGAGIKRQGQENLAKGVVGVGALAFALNHRKDNQDSNWWEIKKDDGSTVDVRGIFPLGPLLGAADILVKGYLGEKPDIKGITEAIVGMKMPAGAQNQLLEQVFDSISSEKDADKASIAIGKVLGDFTNRFTSPFVFKSAYEFLDLFREEGSIQRDPNAVAIPEPVVAEFLGGKETIGSIPTTILEGIETAGRAAVPRVQSKLPIIKENLPEVVPKLREGPVVKEGEFFNSLVGVREIPRKTPAEQEMININVDPFKVYGGGTGNKVYDREYISQINPRVISNIESLIDRPAYQELPMEEKRLKIQAAISHAVEKARGKTLSVFMKTEEGKTMLYKMEFDQLPADERKAINNRYAKENNGVTLEEANDYKQVKKYIGKLGNVKN